MAYYVHYWSGDIRMWLCSVHARTWLLFLIIGEDKCNPSMFQSKKNVGGIGVLVAI